MANYTIDVNFNNNEEDGYNSPFSAPKNSDPTDNDFSFGALVKGVRNFAKAIPGASLIKQSFEWGISVIGRETGSQHAQEVANAAMKIAGQIGGTVMSFAVGGPVAGVLALGATALSYAQEADQSYYDRNIESINLRLLRERGGASLNRSRREE